jgi:predicted metal-dependent hydrolase
MKDRTEITQMAGLEVVFTRKRVKNINLRIQPATGAIHVSASPRVNRRYVEGFIASRKDWIAAAQQRLQLRRDSTEPDLAEGQQVPFLGDYYELVLSKIDAPGISDEKLVLALSQESSSTQIKHSLEEFYRSELRTKLSLLSEYWEQVVGAKSSEYRVRRMKTRWGSCNTQKARINMSLELAKFPLACIEYVLVHELTHLLEPSHNKRFHSLVADVMPDWKERKAFLNKGIAPK